MAEPPSQPAANGDTRDKTGVEPAHHQTSGAPRWAKVFGIIAAVVVLLFVIMLLTGGGGGHGPGRHSGSGAVGRTAPSGMTSLGAQSP